MRTKGSKNKHHKRIINDGYIQVFMPEHPMAMRNGYVREHRMIAYDAGLLTDKSMEVNHINGNKIDNRIANFEILNKIEHATKSTPLGSKRPRHGSKPCRFCPKLTASKYGLCTYHYRLQWERVKQGRIANIYENPELLSK